MCIFGVVPDVAVWCGRCELIKIFSGPRMARICLMFSKTQYLLFVPTACTTEDGVKVGYRKWSLKSETNNYAVQFIVHPVGWYPGTCVPVYPGTQSRHRGKEDMSVIPGYIVPG